MKCDDCPLKSDEFDYMESGIKSTVCPYRYEDCHLTPASLAAIREAVEEEDKVLVAVPKVCVECCTPSEAGCACCVVWQDNEKEGGE